MAKFYPPRLTKQERDELFLELCEALAVLKTREEVAHLLKDLFSIQELEMIAKRLKIAKLLMTGKSYQAIGNTLRVSATTIARVGAWLVTSGEGFRLIAQRTKEEPLRAATEEYLLLRQPGDRWERFKRGHSLYFWPELLLKDIVASATKRKRERLLKTLSILEKTKEKSKLFSDLKRLLHSPQSLRIQKS